MKLYKHTKEDKYILWSATTNVLIGLQAEEEATKARSLKLAEALVRRICMASPAETKEETILLLLDILRRQVRLLKTHSARLVTHTQTNRNLRRNVNNVTSVSVRYDTSPCLPPAENDATCTPIRTGPTERGARAAARPSRRGHEHPGRALPLEGRPVERAGGCASLRCLTSFNHR
jgi:hypothetical protein